VFRKERQINTKMLFVKTKQETIWLFLLPAWFGCEDNMFKHVKTCLNMFRHVQTCSDMFRTLFIIFIGVSLQINQQDMCDARKRNFE